mmetsp:Transcript_3191/g.8393  ORF Transcript_3191/g.8393 Transcript_3191/m.8393 type:complete len:182 (-) Transcript_3191:147-692(-)
MRARRGEARRQGPVGVAACTGPVAAGAVGADGAPLGHRGAARSRGARRARRQAARARIASSRPPTFFFYFFYQHPHDRNFHTCVRSQGRELVALRQENEALLVQLRVKAPADGAEATYRARQLAVELSKAEVERAQLSSRATNAEEQLEQLQMYMTQHIASYQKEILSLRRQVALAGHRTR